MSGIPVHEKNVVASVPSAVLLVALRAIDDVLRLEQHLTIITLEIAGLEPVAGEREVHPLFECHAIDPSGRPHTVEGRCEMVRKLWSDSPHQGWEPEIIEFTFTGEHMYFAYRAHRLWENSVLVKTAFEEIPPSFRRQASA